MTNCQNKGRAEENPLTQQGHNTQGCSRTRAKGVGWEQAAMRTTVSAEMQTKALLKSTLPWTWAVSKRR